MKQIDPTSLEAIFNKNPNDITDAERDRIIAYYREERLSWKFDEANKKAPGKKKAAFVPGTKLEDLGL